MKTGENIGIVCLLAAGLLAGTIARADVCNKATYNLVSNCSFETGNFTGWSGTSTTDVMSNNNGVDSYNAYVGQYAAFLGSPGGTETLSQAVATTPGVYRIIFALLNETSPSPGYTNSFQALFGGTTLLDESAVAAGNYTVYNVLAATTGASTTLSFVSENDGGYFDLDSVSVSQAPEPSSLVLLGTGALGLIGAARRRIKT